jgi:hypothetical protein
VMLRPSADGNASFFGEDEAGRAVMLSSMTRSSAPGSVTLSKLHRSAVAVALSIYA